MNHSLTFPVGYRSASRTLGSRTFKISVNHYSNRIFLCVSDRDGEPGTFFSVKKDNPIPNPAFGTAEPTFSVQTLFGAEPLELLLTARAVGEVIGEFTDKPLLFALALVEASKPTILFICEQVRDLLKSFS